MDLFRGDPEIAGQTAERDLPADYPSHPELTRNCVSPDLHSRSLDDIRRPGPSSVSVDGRRRALSMPGREARDRYYYDHDRPCKANQVEFRRHWSQYDDEPGRNKCTRWREDELGAMISYVSRTRATKKTRSVSGLERINEVTCNWVVSETFGSTCQYDYAFSDRCSGETGSVYRATLTEPGNFTGSRVVAVKVICLPNGLNAIKETERWMLLRQRLKNLINLSHSSLIKYHKVSIGSVSEEATRLELLMDYYSGGSLASLMRNLHPEEFSLDYSAVQCYALQMANAVQYLHEHDLRHGSLQPNVVFVERSFTSAHYAIAVGELEGSVETEQTASKMAGTYRYMSPEMITRLAVDDRNVIGRKTDIWSLGCIVLELCNNLVNERPMRLYNWRSDQRFEFDERTPKDIYVQKITDGFLPYVDSRIPKSLLSCIQQCLNRDSVYRISADELLRQLREGIPKTVRSFSVKHECACTRITAAIQNNRNCKDFNNNRNGSSRSSMQTVINSVKHPNSVDNTITDCITVADWMNGCVVLQNVDGRTTCVFTAEQFRTVEAIADRMIQFHELEEGGFDFRPKKVMLRPHVQLFPSYERSQSDERYIKTHYAEAVHTLLYTAPEILRGNNKSDVKSLQMADIWGFACLCLYIVSGKDPQYFVITDGQEKRQLNNDKNAFVSIALMVAKGGKPDYAAYCIKNSPLDLLFRECFHENPLERPSAVSVGEKLRACKPETPSTT